MEPIKPVLKVYSVSVINRRISLHRYERTATASLFIALLLPDQQTFWQLHQVRKHEIWSHPLTSRVVLPWTTTPLIACKPSRSQTCLGCCPYVV
jgi:hypothetical protein